MDTWEKNLFKIHMYSKRTVYYPGNFKCGHAKEVSNSNVYLQNR